MEVLGSQVASGVADPAVAFVVMGVILMMGFVVFAIYKFMGG